MAEKTMDVVGLLVAEHQKVEKLFARIEETPIDGLKELFCEMCEELVRHELAEEMVVYPAFRKYVPEGDTIAESCIREQSQVEETLARLESEDGATERFRTQLIDFRQVVLAHTEHEEADVFPVLSSNIDDAELVHLGNRYEHARNPPQRILIPTPRTT